MVVLVDVSDRWMCSRLDFEVLKCLAQHPDIPAILVLNKVFLPRLIQDQSMQVNTWILKGSWIP